MFSPGDSKESANEAVKKEVTKGDLFPTGEKKNKGRGGKERESRHSLQREQSIIIGYGKKGILKHTKGTASFNEKSWEGLTTVSKKS